MKQVVDSMEMSSIEQVIADFLFHCQYEKNLNDKTIYAYRSDLSQFAKYVSSLHPSMFFEQISKDVLKAYFQHISHYKPKSIKRKIASLKALFNYYDCENDNFINPFRKLHISFKEPFVLPTVMTTNEVKQILSYLYKTRNDNPYVNRYSYKAQLRDITVIELLFATGIRVSELCELRRQDIDFRQSIIKVFGKGSKERIIQICSKEVLNILKEYNKEFQPKDHFFTNRIGKQLSPQSVRLLVKRCRNAIGIDKHITPHTFRHSFATLLMEEDVGIKYIQNLLGHSSITTTQIYTHVNMHKQRKILSTKHPRGKMKFN